MAKSVAMNVFLENLKFAMEERGLNTSTLATRSGLSISSMSRVLNGKEKMTIERAERVATAVGFSLSELFSHDFQKTPA